MKIQKLIFAIFLILLISCDEQKVETEYHKIADINGKFPLPKDYFQISSEKAMVLAGGMNKPNSKALTNKMNAKLNHFIDKNNEQNLVSITNAVPKLDIEKEFLNGFAQMIEEETFNNLSKPSNHRLIDKKFFKSKDNKSLKVKFDYESAESKKYFTLFLVTTTKQSFIITQHSNTKSDIQTMVTEYMRKN
ncbi:hypothetical protein SAMN04488096_1206 [Mesonia phycicola]|uniref:Uncharacterized protein n=1 Tax=Mesonia phycicola TaxID=579105 RepID=A0A1M6HSM8_9FLAO|nr:hypothetical protein [Mesonia phycicola]SHJ25158.1 hypothetical protein SAMN04488096_1206 [Mesonia phycicola]